MFNIKKLHCIGIGGIGVSAIARFFKSQDIEVSGSDIALTDELKDARTNNNKTTHQRHTRSS